jgi:hypothetical protein
MTAQLHSGTQMHWFSKPAYYAALTLEYRSRIDRITMYLAGQP